MPRLKCLLKLKDGVKLLCTLTWMSCIIYALLMKLAENELTDQHYSALSEEIDNVLLSDLGFNGQPKLYPQGYHHIDEKEWPVFALALGPDDMEQFMDFMLAFRQYFFDHRLVIFSFGINKKQKEFVADRCYCQVRQVQWNRYPKHVQNLRLQAYLPLLIQNTLLEFGSVFWCDIAMRFNTSAIKHHLNSQSLKYGLSAWTRDRYPTSTYTHYNTYKHFSTNQSNYYFHKMVYPVPALYYNTESLHNDVMQPWIQCVLKLNCLSPVGAQYSGCNLNLKPKYRYSGCHRYSVSVLNVILGKVFSDNTPYIAEHRVYNNELPNVVSNFDYMKLW